METPQAANSDSIQVASDEVAVARVAKLKMKAMRWARPHVENFENMSFAEFQRHARHEPEVVSESQLGPTSMKHPSWKGSDAPAGPCLPLTAVLISLLIALVVGLAVGLSIDSTAWGAGSGAIAMGVAFFVFFLCLVSYMACYSNGLHNPPMPCWVARGGFMCNVRANVLCRYIMMCCYNGHVDIVDCIMGGEADGAFRRIQGMNNGNGPAPGGVCWIGDSEFTFWHGLDQDMKEFFIKNNINAGFGGSRIKDISRNVHRLCLDWDPSIVIVHASGNDYDFDLGVTAGEIPVQLVKLFEKIAAHPSVTRIGYMLSSRRPVYSDTKWDFMVRVHGMTLDAIQKSSSLKDKVQVFDLRANVWPLDHFLPTDRVHMNLTGHRKKSEVLLSKMLAIWPPASSSSSLRADAPVKDDEFLNNV